METFLGIVHCKMGDEIFALRHTIIAESAEIAYKILQSDIVWNTHFNKNFKVVSYGLVG